MIVEKEGLFFVRCVSPWCRTIGEKHAKIEKAESAAMRAGFQWLGYVDAPQPGWYCPICTQYPEEYGGKS